MKLLKNLSQPAVALLLATLSLAASAQDLSRSIGDRNVSGHIGDDEDDQFPGSIRPIGHGDNSYCQNYSAYDCDYVQGCQFSRIYNQCVASTGPVRPIPQNPNYCSNYHYYQAQCLQVGCFYDTRNGACLAPHGPGPRPYPGPGPGPRPYPGPGPAPRPYPGPVPQRGFVCVAEDNGYEEHRIGHQGLGRTQYEASVQALAICRNQHRECHVTSCYAQ